MVEQHGGKLREWLVGHFSLQQRLQLVTRLKHGEINVAMRGSIGSRSNRLGLTESLLFGHVPSLSFRLVKPYLIPTRIRQKLLCTGFGSGEFADIGLFGRDHVHGFDNSALVDALQLACGDQHARFQ